MIDIKQRESVINCARRNWFFILLWLFFFFVGKRVPVIGDDWEISQWYKTDFITTFWGDIRAWSYFNGRILNNFFDSFFAFHRTLWIPFSAFIHAASIYFISKTYRFNEKKIALMTIVLMLLSVSGDIRKEIQFHIVGNVSYTICIFLIIYYNYLIVKEKENVPCFHLGRLGAKAVYIILAFSLSLWIENFTLGFLSYIIVYALRDLISKKRVSTSITCGFFGSVLGAAVIFSSVGVSSRINQGTGGHGILATVRTNYKVVLSQLVAENYFIFFIFILCLWFFVWANRDTIKNRTLRLLLLIYTGGLATILGLYQFLNILYKNYFHVSNLRDKIFNTLLNLDTTSVIPLITVVLILLAVCFAILCLQRKVDLLPLFVLAFASAAPMVLSPGNRNLMLTIYVLIVITGVLISFVHINVPGIKATVSIAVAMLLLARVDNYSVALAGAVKITKQRNAYISAYLSTLSEGKITDNDWLVLPRYGDDILKTSNPGIKDFHMNSMKRFYDMPLDSKVIVDDGVLAYDLQVETVQEGSYRLVVGQIDMQRKFKYRFRLKNKDGSEVVLGEPGEKYITFHVEKPGDYYPYCDVINTADGRMNTVYAAQPIHKGD